MRMSAVGVVAIAAALAGAAGAQERTDLSGTWRATKEAAPGGATIASTPVFGDRFSLLLKGDSVTFVRQLRDMTLPATFTLDGKEARVRVAGPLCQPDVESVEKAAWEGNAIAHTVVGSVAPGSTTVSPRNIKRVFRLEAADTLVVETSMVQSGQPRPTATVYKRTSEAIPRNDSPVVNGPPATMAQLAWLPGVWSGTTGQVTTEERWTPAAGGSTIGVSRTLRNNIMAAFEFLCIVERGGTLVYSAMPNARSPATHFTLTSITPDAVTFENPAHDFPKIIRYARRADGSLEATVSGAGGQRAQTFVMKKQE